MGERIDGSLIAEKTRDILKEQIETLVSGGKRRPKLVVFLVGDDPRSGAYVRNKQRSCEYVGIEFVLEHYPADIDQETVISRIREYNDDESVDGMIVQLPLPSHLDESVITETVSGDKDVDGLHSDNILRLYNNDPDCLVPATPSGILKMLEFLKIEVDGKHAVIVGRGKLVGHPLSLLMLNHNATVTVCHSHTRQLEEITKTADILIVGIGKAGYINSSHIKEGAVVIDAGINVNEEGRLTGDCDYEDMLEKAAYITPVPKGVGPMTVAMLMYNVTRAYERNVKYGI